MAISITEKTANTNTTKSTGRSIKYIVVHYTAGTSSASGAAANTAAYFAKSTTKASADFIVDDATIVQYNPDIENRYCWHCGGTKLSGSQGGSLYKTATNKNSIGVEICSTNSTGTVKDANDSTWSYTDAVLKKAKTLVKYLMETYDIDSDHVIRHYDVTGKLCPGIVGWNADSGDESKWESFKKSLTSSSSSSSSSSSDSTASTSSSGSFKDGMTDDDCPFKVKVSISNLNIRKGAGTNYAKTGKYTGKGVFTITQVKEGTGSDVGWGKLKSGAGWISLSYCTLVS